MLSFSWRARCINRSANHKLLFNLISHFRFRHNDYYREFFASKIIFIDRNSEKCLAHKPSLTRENEEHRRPLLMCGTCLTRIGDSSLGPYMIYDKFHTKMKKNFLMSTFMPNGSFSSL